MGDQTIEQRLTRIEEQIANLAERLTVLDDQKCRGFEMHEVSLLKLDLRLREVELRMKEFREVERIAQEAYFKTNPEALSGLREAIDAVETARGQQFFSTLPTIKDRDAGSKS
jgi:hypothetical protein